MTVQLKEKRIHCPHCGHHSKITLDLSKGDQDYYEPCPVCCNDIHLNLHIDEYRKTIELGIDSDDEQVF